MFLHVLFTEKDYTDTLHYNNPRRYWSYYWLIGWLLTQINKALPHPKHPTLIANGISLHFIYYLHCCCLLYRCNCFSFL